MELRANIRFFCQLLRTSIRASIHIRGAFLLESILMIANNLIFIFIWWIFFRQFDEIAGWKLNDMIILNTIGIGAYGIYLICFGGIKYLSSMILKGDLDPFMTQPKNVLVHLIGSKSLSKGWGHLLTSFLLIFIGGLFQPSVLLAILLGIVCGALVFTAIGIIAHSLAFWMGSVENVSRQYCNSVFLFALYPTNIYSGGLQLLMFTLLPAGIIGYLPVELARSFSIVKLLCLVASSLSFFVIAFLVFHLGLKRYESGNQFGLRL